MVIVWHEGILHSSAKSIPLTEADDVGRAATQLTNVPCSANRRSNGETMSTLHIAGLVFFFITERRTTHKLVHGYQGRDKQMVLDFIGWSITFVLNLKTSCRKCSCSKTVIDLRPITGYQGGERITGNIESLGWVVLKGIGVNDKL